MSTIKIGKSSTADTRSCDFANVRRDVIDCRLGETYSADEWEQTAKLSDACADACSAIAAECRAVEGHGNDPGSLPKRERGLYGKFRVERRDGTDQPGLKHDGCKYFVLDMTHDPFAKPALEAYANACGAEYPALAADLLRAVGECRAVEGPDKPRVESPTGTWTLTTDPDCPRAWEHRRDGGTVDSLVFADEVVHMYHVQQGQGLDAATSERATPRDSGDADAGLDTQRTTAHPAPAPAADDDVETVRSFLYGWVSDEALAVPIGALDRLAARLAHLEGQQRLCEIDCANQEARANDAESRLAQFEALAERAHNALDGDNMIAGVRVLHDLAALRREGA